MTRTQAPARLAHVRALWAAREHDAALQEACAVVDEAPDDPAGYLALADILIFCGRTSDACLVLDRGLTRLPGHFAMEWARCVATLPACYADDEEIELVRTEYATRLFTLRARWRSGTVAIAALNICAPFGQPYQGHDDKALQSVWGSLVSDIMAAAFPQRPLQRGRQPGERIKIGFVSGCFWRHSVWRMPMRGWIENIDRDRFQLFGYHTRAEHDDQTNVAARLFDRFVNAPGSVAQWIAEIEHDAPHILIYPELGMDSTSTALAALRISPVQCTSLGHPATTGLSTIDYFLSSDLMEPPNGQNHYSEQLVRLPGLGSAYRPAWASFGDELPPVSAWDELRLPTDAVRFLSCQNVSKYLPQHDDIFPRIAAALPSARFAFVATRLHPTLVFQNRLRAAFARYGLNADDFCSFVPGMSCARFEVLVRDADVFLDTPEWSGFNTSLAALAHVVPIVTTPGRFMRGRHTTAMLTAAGVTETVASDVDDYIATEIHLGTDGKWRRQVSDKMRRGAERAFSDMSSVRALEKFLLDATATHKVPVAA